MIDSRRRAAWPHLVARCSATVALVVLASATAGCHDLLNPPLPAGTQDPKTFNTEAGALARYWAVIDAAGNSFPRYVGVSADLTDEMQRDALSRPQGVVNPVDERILPEGQQGTSDDGAPGEEGALWTQLHVIRASASEAIGALAKYAPSQPAALRGELYALAAFAEIDLADLYCSGIPLSTFEFEGDFTYHAGSTTSEVYQHAIALLDTAAALGADSARIVNLALVGKARALLDLGQYGDAATAAAGVPDGFLYLVPVDWRGQLVGQTFDNPPVENLTVSDKEGVNGLDFVSSGDPRAPTHLVDLDGTHMARVPDVEAGVVPLTLASGTEARLIQAEGALQGSDASWLTMLNTLRTDGSFDTQPDPNDASKTDTLWHAGTGGVAGLAPLTDPGTTDARVDLLFRERAFWLFMTGHRQGDLRRLIREYHRQQNQVYPTGTYAGGLGTYGSDVTVPIPPAERANPLFTGCFNRNP